MYGGEDIRGRTVSNSLGRVLCLGAVLLFAAVFIIGLMSAGSDDSSAFSVDDYEYLPNGTGTVKIVSYTGTSTSVDIPTEVTYDDVVYSVTEIGASAFANNRNIQYLQMLGPVYTIGNFAFSGCNGILSVNMTQVRYIGENAFYECTRLASLSLGTGLETIAPNAFQSTRITSVTLPSTVSSVSPQAFLSCTRLTDIIVGEGNPYYSNYNMDGVLYSFDNSVIIICPAGNLRTEFNIPNKVVEVGDYAFYGCSNLTKVNFTGNVSKIGTSAFSRCSSIELFTGYDKVTSIGASAFSGCSRLESFNFPSITVVSQRMFADCSYLSSVKFMTTITAIEDYAFYNCENLSAVSTNAGLQSIGQYAFYGCSHVNTLTIASTVTTVKDYAFSGCSDIATLSIPDSVRILEHTFEGCTGLSHVSFTRGNGDVSVYTKNNYMYTPWYQSRENKISVTFGNSMTAIGDYTFYDCHGLGTTLSISSTIIESIGDYAFYMCSGIGGQLSFPTTLKTIGEYAFYGCSEITQRIQIQSRISSIGDGAFGGCSKITDFYVNSQNQYYKNDSNGVLFNYDMTVLIQCYGAYTGPYSIPSTVTEIKAGAFAECTGMVGSLVIPSSVSVIGDRAFYGCTGLSGTLSIPDTVSKIGDYAFADCTGFNGNFTIPTTLVYIGKYAFDNCRNLTGDIVIPDSMSSVPEGLFRNCYNFRSLTLSKFVTSIGDFAFFGCSGLTGTLLISDNVVSIGDGTFGYCTGINTIYMPITLNPKMMTFEACYNITTVYLTPGNSGIGNDYTSTTSRYTPWYYSRDNQISINMAGGIVRIGNYTFFECTGLSGDVAIPSTVAEIGTSAFESCSGIETIEIPASVTSIGNLAFVSCQNLKAINVDENNQNYCSDKGILLSKDKTMLIVCPGGYVGTFTIPDAVTVLDSFVFQGCVHLTEVVIPDTVTLINTQCFTDCTSLADLTLPIDVTIKNNAFSRCVNIKNILLTPGQTGIGPDYTSGTAMNLPWRNSQVNPVVTIAGGVTKIGAYMFADSNVYGVHLSSTVSYIGNYAFNNCRSLHDLTVPVDVPYYNSQSYPLYTNCIALERLTLIPGANGRTSGREYSKQLVEYMPWYKSRGHDITLTISEGITSLGSYMFYNCTGIKGFSIPSSMQSIGEYIFYGTQGTKQVDLSENFEYFGSCAFAMCTSIESFNVDPGNLYFKTDRGVLFNKDGSTLIQCPTSFEGEYIMPSKTMTINEYAFYGCTKLSSLVIPESVVTLSDYSFYQCSSIESLTLPGMLMISSNNIFYNCESIRTVVFSDCASHSVVDYNWTTISYTPWYKSSNAGMDISVEFSEGLTSIGTNVLDRCSHVVSVKIPNSMQIIGSNAFNGCSGITSLTVPISLDISQCMSSSNRITDFVITPGTGYGIEYTSTTYNALPWVKNNYSTISVTLEKGIEAIGSYMFAGATRLESIDIPSTVTSMGSYVFYNCSSLKSVTLPEELKSIGESSFRNCGRLAEISVPGDIVTIDRYMFYQCSSLMKVEFLGSTSIIGDYALANCSSLLDLTIPDSIVSVGQYAFQGCSSLTNLTIPIDFFIDRMTFNQCNSVTHVTFTPGITGYGVSYDETNYMFTPWYLNRNSSTDITIEFRDSEDRPVLSIGDYTFKGCTRVTNIQLPTYLQTIGNHVFEGTNLIEIVVPDTVTIIGDAAFKSDMYLTKAVISNGLITPGKEMFYGCSALSSLQIPVNLPLTDDNMYYQCTSLRELIITPGNDYIGGRGFDYTEYTHWDTPWYKSTYDFSVTILEGVTYIGNYTFHDCTHMTELTIYDPTTQYGSSVFGGWITFWDEKGHQLAKTVDNLSGHSFKGERLRDTDGHYYVRLYQHNIVTVSGVELDMHMKEVKETTSPREKYFTLKVTIKPSDATDPSVKWTSSNPSVVTVDKNGQVTIIGRGTATITVTSISSGVSDACEIKVKHNITYYPAVEPRCNPVLMDGNIEYWYCSYCKKRYADPDGNVELTSWVIEAHHDLEYKESQRATCVEEGHLEHYHCKECGLNFSDAEAQIPMDDVTIPKEPHSTVFVPGYPAVGSEAGQVDYYHCLKCGFDYDDEKGTNRYIHLDTYNVVINTNDPSLGDVDTPYLTSILRGADIYAEGNYIVVDGIRIKAIPTEITDEKECRFEYWQFGSSTVTGYTEIMAVFSGSIRQYSVLFYESDDAATSSIWYSYVDDYGSIITAPSKNPTKDPSLDGRYVYEFQKWIDSNGKDYMPGTVLKGDTEYRPVFKQITRTYRITFLSEGQIYQQDILSYGSAINAPSVDPEKESTERINYIFKGWEGYTPGMRVNSNYNFEAIFEGEVRYYTAIFMNGDEIFEIYDDLEFEEEIPDPGTPTKDPKGNFQFEFSGWDNYAPGVKIIKDVTFNAMYTKVLYTYEVDDEGRVVIDSTDVTNFTISRDTIMRMKNEVSQKTLIQMEVDFAYGSITLDAGSISSLPNSKQKVSFDILDYDRMPAAMKRIVGERTVYNINFGTVHQFNGIIDITLRYEPGPREDVNNLVVWYVTTSGTHQDIKCSYSNGYVSFQTDHLSYYSVILSEPPPNPGDWPLITLIVVGVVALGFIGLAYMVFRRQSI